MSRITDIAKEMKTWWDEDDDTYVHRALDEIIRIDQEQATSIDIGWIPCNERLPEKTGKYLVTTAKGSVCFDRFYANGQYWGRNEPHNPYKHKGVHIAWMPLPESYEAEQTEPQTEEWYTWKGVDDEQMD